MVVYCAEIPSTSLSFFCCCCCFFNIEHPSLGSATVHRLFWLQKSGDKLVISMFTQGILTVTCMMIFSILCNLQSLLLESPAVSLKNQIENYKQIQVYRELQEDLGETKFFFFWWVEFFSLILVSLTYLDLDYNLMMVCFVTELNRQLCNNYLF